MLCWNGLELLWLAGLMVLFAALCSLDIMIPYLFEVDSLVLLYIGCLSSFLKLQLDYYSIFTAGVELP